MLCKYVTKNLPHERETCKSIHLYMYIYINKLGSHEYNVKI